MNKAASSPQMLKARHKPIKIHKPKNEIIETSNTRAATANLPPPSSNSYIRTTTLPRLFKEKFFSKYNHSSTSSTLDSTISNISNSRHSPLTCSNVSVCNNNIPTINSNINNSQSSSITNSSVCSATSSTSELNKCLVEPEDTTGYSARTANLRHLHSKQLQSLKKYVEKFLKAIKYLEQIILKKKYEIIASSITAILETVLDIYNAIQSFDTPVAKIATRTRHASLMTNSKTFKLCRVRVNKSLANLIKWSDSILFLNSATADTNELFSEKSLYDSARALISELNRSIKHLVKYLKKFFVSQEIWSEQYMDADVQESIRTLPINSNFSLSSSSMSSLDDRPNELEKLVVAQPSRSAVSSPLKSKVESVGSVDSAQLASAPVETIVTKTVDETNAVQITHTTVKSTSNLLLKRVV